MSNRHYERGGVVSFFVVATVLALLFAGALLWAKNQGRSTQVAGEPTTSQVTQNSSSEDNTSSSATNDAAVPSQPNSSQQKTSDSSPTATSNTGNSSSTTNSGQGSTSSKPSTAPLSNTTTNTVVSTGPSVDQIPEAGPAEVVATVIAMSAVSATLYILVQSQKRVRLSALK